MVSYGSIDCDRVGGTLKGGASGSLSWGDKLLGRPNVLWGGFCEEVGPVGVGCSFDGLEVAELGLPSSEAGVGGLVFLGLAGGLLEFFGEG